MMIKIYSLIESFFDITTNTKLGIQYASGKCGFMMKFSRRCAYIYIAKVLKVNKRQ